MSPAHFPYHNPRRLPAYARSDSDPQKRVTSLSVHHPPSYHGPAACCRKRIPPAPGISKGACSAASSLRMAHCNLGSEVQREQLKLVSSIVGVDSSPPGVLCGTGVEPGSSVTNSRCQRVPLGAAWNLRSWLRAARRSACSTWTGP